MDISGLRSVEHDWSGLAHMHAMEKIETLNLLHLYAWVSVYLHAMYACLYVCVRMFIWLVIWLIWNINFELIVHLICIYIMFLLISSFIFQKILRKKMVKSLKICYSQTALTRLISWALEIPMLLIHTPFLVLFFSYISTVPSLSFKLQIFRLCSLSLVSLTSFFNSHFFCSI